MKQLFDLFPKEGVVFIAAPSQGCLTSLLLQATLHYWETKSVTALMPELGNHGIRNRIRIMMTGMEQPKGFSSDEAKKYRLLLKTGMAHLSNDKLALVDATPEMLPKSDVTIIDDWDMLMCDGMNDYPKDVFERVRREREAIGKVKAQSGLVIIGMRTKLYPQGVGAQRPSPFNAMHLNCAKMLLVMERTNVKDNASWHERPTLSIETYLMASKFKANLAFDRERLSLRVVDMEIDETPAVEQNSTPEPENQP